MQFSDSECAKKALEQLNGFELAGRPMKVGHVTERTDASNASSFLDSDELERTGIDLGTTGRLQLMARLAEGMKHFYIFLGWQVVLRAYRLSFFLYAIIRVDSSYLMDFLFFYLVCGRYRSTDSPSCSASFTDEWVISFWSCTR